MNVNLIGVGAGYSYVVSGPTHQCYEDITLMRGLPNFHVLSPSDHITTEHLFGLCAGEIGPKYLRLDAQVLPVVYANGPPDLTKGFHVHRRGQNICLVATGYMVHTALIVADRLREAGAEIGLIDLFDLARFSAKALREELSLYQTIVSMEEGFAGRGGLDALLYNFLGRSALDAKLLNIGVEGGYRFELGSRAELHEQVGIGPDVVTKRLLQVSASSSKALTPLNTGRA